MARAAWSWVVGLCLFSGLVLGADTQQQKKPARPAAQPDIKFLEYLGTLEGDDENWTEIAAIALAEPKGKPSAKPEAAAKPAAEKK